MTDFQKAQSNKILSCYSIDDIEKSGPGSRGGKVIGYTKSGKPIYDSHHSSYSNFSPQDHHDATEVHTNLHKKFKKEGDLDTAQHHYNQAADHIQERLK